MRGKVTVMAAFGYFVAQVTLPFYQLYLTFFKACWWYAWSPLSCWNFE
jgi:hypothetical protein